MIVGLAACEFIIYDAHSLKEKRAVLQRMLTRLKQKFNVSIAEVDFQDTVAKNKNCHCCCVFCSVIQQKSNCKMPSNFLIHFRKWNERSPI